MKPPPRLVADMLEPGGDSVAAVTTLTGTTQGSSTQCEGNAAHEAAAEQGHGEDTTQVRRNDLPCVMGGAS